MSVRAIRGGGSDRSTPVSAEPSKAIVLAWLVMVAAPPGRFSPVTE